MRGVDYRLMRKPLDGNKPKEKMIGPSKTANAATIYRKTTQLSI
jgi:hypothetical protein